MNYSPLENRLLVRPFKEVDEKTESGLFIPVNVKKDVLKGEVYAAGVGKYAGESGVFLPCALNKGDVVLFGASAGMEIPVETDNGREEMRLMREDDVLILISKASENS